MIHVDPDPEMELNDEECALVAQNRKLAATIAYVRRTKMPEAVGYGRVHQEHDRQLRERPPK